MTMFAFNPASPSTPSLSAIFPVSLTHPFRLASMSTDSETANLSTNTSYWTAARPYHLIFPGEFHGKRLSHDLGAASRFQLQSAKEVRYSQIPNQTNSIHYCVKIFLGKSFLLQQTRTIRHNSLVCLPPSSTLLISFKLLAFPASPC